VTKVVAILRQLKYKGGENVATLRQNILEIQEEVATETMVGI